MKKLLIALVAVFALGFLIGCESSPSSPCKEPSAPINVRAEYRPAPDSTYTRLYIVWDNIDTHLLYWVRIQYAQGCAIESLWEKVSLEGMWMGQIGNCGLLTQITVRVRSECGEASTTKELP